MCNLKPHEDVGVVIVDRDMGQKDLPQSHVHLRQMRQTRKRREEIDQRPDAPKPPVVAPYHRLAQLRLVPKGQASANIAAPAQNEEVPGARAAERPGVA